MMQTKDKVSQLKDSIEARKKAEAQKQAQAPVPPEQSVGMQQKYQQKIEALEKKLEKALTDCESLKTKAAEAHDQFLRKHAEYENFRKRMQREKQEMAKYGVENMGRELLPALDSLEKAVEHADESTEMESLINGVQLVLKQLLQALEKCGMVPVSAVGQSFDPNVHEAVGHIESEEHPADMVIEEHRRGYKLHDRLLRPAMVSVSKGPGNNNQES